MSLDNIQPKVDSPVTNRQLIPTDNQLIHDILVNQLKITYIDEITTQILAQLQTFKGIGFAKIQLVNSWLDPNFAAKSVPDMIPIETDINQSTYYPEILLPTLAEKLKIVTDVTAPLAGLSDNDYQVKLFLKQLGITGSTSKDLVWAWSLEVSHYEEWKTIHAGEKFVIDQLQTRLDLLGLRLPANTTELIVDSDVRTGPGEILNEVLYRLETVADRFTRFDAAFQRAIDHSKHWADIIRLDKLLNSPTLNEIGQQLGLTRERVRQVKARINGARDWWSQIYQIQEVIALTAIIPDRAVLWQDLSADIQARIDVLEIPKITIGRLPILVMPNLENEIRQQLTRLDWQLVDTTETFSTKRLAIFRELLPNYDLQSDNLIRDIQSQYDYPYFLGDTLCRRKMTDTTYLLKLATDNPNMVFNCDTSGISQLKTIFQQQFHHDLFQHPVKNESRALTSKFLRLVDTNELTYLGNNQFRLANHRKLSPTLCDRVASTLNARLKDVPEVSLNSLYQQFKHEADYANIENRYEFYYELRYFLSGEFTFGHANTMSIRKDGAVITSIQESLQQYLTNNGGYARVEEVCQAFGWPDYTVNQTVFFCPTVNIHDNWVLQQDFVLPQSLQIYLQGLITQQTNQHPEYLLTNEIKKQLLEDPIWKQRLLEATSHLPFAEKYLTNTNYFADIVVWLDPRWKGHAFVKYQNDNFDHAQLLADSFQQQVLSRSIISTFYHDLGYKDSSIYDIIRRLQDRNRLIAVGNNNLVLASRLSSLLDRSEVTEAVNRFLGKQLPFSQPDAYVSLVDQSTLPSNLPHLTGLEWTPELISYIATQDSYYRKLEWQGPDNVVLPIDPMIMVRRNSSITSITALTRMLMSHYQGEWNVSGVVNYLKSCQILINPKGTQIPEVLSDVLYIDDYKMVHPKRLKVESTKTDHKS